MTLLGYLSKLPCGMKVTMEVTSGFKGMCFGNCQFNTVPAVTLAIIGVAVTLAQAGNGIHHACSFSKKTIIVVA